MKTVNVTLTGIAPILFNRWPDPALALSGPSKTLTEEQRITEAWTHVYRGPDGILTLPAWNIKKCIIDGAMFSRRKIGKEALSKMLRPMLFLPADGQFGVTEADFLHSHPGKAPPRTGGPTIVRRPALNPGWRLTFSLTTAPELLTSVKSAIEDAGLYVGLAGWRPEFGRFELTEFS